MGYIVKRRRRHAAPPGPFGMGDLLEDLAFALGGPYGMAIQEDPVGALFPVVGAGAAVADATSSSDAECIASANQKTAQLDAIIADLAKNWKPSGFYSPAQIDKLVEFGNAIGQRSLESLDNALSEWSATASTLQEEKTGMTKVLAESAPFIAGAAQARLQGIAVVDSPAIRRWILRVMQHASSSMAAVSVTACLKPWFVAAFQVLLSVANAAYDFMKTMAEVAMKLGEQVLKIPDTIETLATLIKIGAVGALAWFLYTEYDKHRSRRGS